MQIKELFSEYIDVIPNSIRKGEILKLQHTKDMKKLFVYASFEQIQSNEYITDFEKNLEKALNLESFLLLCRYKPNLFSEKAVPELINRLKRKIHLINGNFQGAMYNLQDNTLTIAMKGSGRTMLVNAGFERELSKMIKEYFQRDIIVILKSMYEEEQENSAEVYQRNIQYVLENMPADHDIPPENPAAVYNRDISSEEIVTVNYKDLPILAEGAEIVKGRKIDSPVVNIGDLTGKINNVTIWGDAFDYQEKEGGIVLTEYYGNNNQNRRTKTYCFIKSYRLYKLNNNKKL